MAVYTQISDDQLRAFLADYEVGELQSFKGIAEGVQNTNFLVRTNQSPFILTLYEKLVDVEDLPFFLGLMEHLARHDISCPLPVHDKKGDVLKKLSGRPAVMVSFLDGYSVSRPSRQNCADLGTALASLHLAGKDFELSRPNALSLPGWQTLAGEIMGNISSAFWSLEGAKIDSSTIMDIISTELEHLQKNWPQELPTGIIHADLFPDNVFFLNERLSGLIDFYFACNDLLAYDLAICLNAWCFDKDGSYNSTRGRALLKGYQKIRPLQPNELTALPLLARGAALRFLLTRIYDWLNTPEDALVSRHDPREYIRKLRFHQKIKTVSEYGFEI
ncbi:MAG: homoserine kinase [Hyphomicrobiaceae bacterium]|nr:homoserine kinase [Hyphomicrobiaceae bacterium]